VPYSFACAAVAGNIFDRSTWSPEYEDRWQWLSVGMRCGPGLHVADSALVKARGPLGAEYPFERCSCRPIKGLRAARTDDEQGHAKNRVASRRLWTSITCSAPQRKHVADAMDAALSVKSET
jgi:hypothetical protein